VNLLRFVDSLDFSPGTPAQVIFDAGRHIERAPHKEHCPPRPPPSATQWICASDVQRLLGCSRSSAYRHLRAASGRHRGEAKLLRVPLAKWEQYAEDTFAP
jgi:hypothetical protein